MEWLKNRLKERSTRIQLLQVASMAISVSTGVPVEVLLGVGATIASIGAVIPDKAEA